jgi:spore coat polysaccharide biosynthesis protein SpsF
MGSTRLPGKALIPIKGRPMLERVVTRVNTAHAIDETVVATTTEDRDDAIAELCSKGLCRVFRGSEEDVLDRYLMAARAFTADVIVRITSDCPLIDQASIDQTISCFLASNSKIDYASNTLPPRTFPRGLDVEVMGKDALERAWREDEDRRSREHVTPYIYRHPGAFRLLRVFNDQDRSAYRWTVDTPEDLAFVQAVYESFDSEDFSQADIAALLERRPELTLINAGIVQKSIDV